ncbi:MAG: hypothetical protein K2G82_00860 [Paramuribaculum sp.]|nr:hypothetical protein [Paramuribaculum sp.]
MGAAGGYFLARTIPADVYSGRSLARLMALIEAINGIAPASAPVIGGVTADHWGWKGVFAHTPHTPPPRPIAGDNSNKCIQKKNE